MTATATAPVVTAAADCCGARATFAVLTPDGELLFCDHHLRQHGARLEAKGYAVERVMS